MYVISLQFFDSDFDENFKRKFSTHFRNLVRAANHLLDNLNYPSPVFGVNLKFGTVE